MMDSYEIFYHPTKRDTLESVIGGWIMKSTHDAGIFSFKKSCQTYPKKTKASKPFRLSCGGSLCLIYALNVEHGIHVTRADRALISLIIGLHRKPLQSTQAATQVRLIRMWPSLQERNSYHIHFSHCHFSLSIRIT